MAIPERKMRVLCSNLDGLRELASQIAHGRLVGTETREIALEIRARLVVCKKQALAMEKRLYLYKETIEGLGFKRVRK